MTSTEKEEADKFLSLAEKYLSIHEWKSFGKFFDQDEWIRFKKFFDHLCKVQNPSSWKHLSCGMAMARICIVSGEHVNVEMILVAIGHDWGRAYGEKRIASSDYPNTEEGFSNYMKALAINSAILFGAEMEKFYSKEIVKRVQYYITRHNDFCEGNIAAIKNAKAMAFLTPQLTDYYRNQRIYLDAEKNPLPPLEMEEARKKGFEIKVRFMIENMNESCFFTVKAFVRTNLYCFEVNVINELMDIMEL